MQRARTMNQYNKLRSLINVGQEYRRGDNWQITEETRTKYAYVWHW